MLIPSTRYRDPEAALAFLQRAFGFAEHAVFRDEVGAIQHVQLRLGDGWLMFGPEADTPFAKHMIPPRETAGRETVAIYAVVPDVAAHYDRAAAAGAEIVRPPEAQDFGGSSYAARDPEGHVWTFGEYDPRR